MSLIWHWCRPHLSLLFALLLSIWTSLCAWHASHIVLQGPSTRMLRTIPCSSVHMHPSHNAYIISENLQWVVSRVVSLLIQVCGVTVWSWRTESHWHFYILTFFYSSLLRTGGKTWVLQVQSPLKLNPQPFMTIMIVITMLQNCAVKKASGGLQPPSYPFCIPWYSWSGSLETFWSSWSSSNTRGLGAWLMCTC